MNTKTLYALIGLVFFVLDITRKKTGTFPRDLIKLGLWALGVSFASFLSMVLNETTDLTYATYIVSAITWCASAYAMVWMLHKINPDLSFEKICDFIIIASVVQCALAWIISRHPETKPFFASFYAGYYGLDEFADGRLYGIGCCFDTGGIRLAASLVLIAPMLCKAIVADDVRRAVLYACAFIIITVVGNMIARTTTVGSLLAMPCFAIYYCRENQGQIRVSHLRILTLLCGILTIGILFISYQYKHDILMQKDLRYAFEGFFSLFEQGEWHVQSNEMLKAHWQTLPETTRTWLIGDGLMGPTTDDLYYTGETYAGFYKNIDAGYLRFLFYFGIIGLSVFSVYMIMAYVYTMRRWREYAVVLFFLLILHFAIWIKVSTDLFFVFAIFIMLSVLLTNEENVANRQDR